MPYTVSPSELAHGLLIRLLGLEDLPNKLRLFEYLLASPRHGSLRDMLDAMAAAQLPPLASHFLVESLGEVCTSPDALIGSIESLGEILNGSEKIAPQERFGTDIRRLVFLVDSGSIGKLVDLYDATVAFCHNDTLPRKTNLPGVPAPRDDDDENTFTVHDNREAHASIEKLHSYFDLAARKALELASPSDLSRVLLEHDGHPPRGSALIQHASLQLCLLLEEFGNNAEAIVAAHEAVLVAHQQNDEAVLKEALSALARLESETSSEQTLDAFNAVNWHATSKGELKSFMWDLFGQASLAVLTSRGISESAQTRVRLAFARINRGTEVDRLLGMRPSKDLAAAFRHLLCPGSKKPDDALVVQGACMLVHRIACLLDDWESAARISSLVPLIPTRIDEFIVHHPAKALALLDEQAGSSIQLCLQRSRIFSGSARGLSWALKAWSSASELGLDSIKALAAVSLARVKFQAGSYKDALKLVLEAGPQIAAHASLIHQGESLLLEVKCRLALVGTEENVVHVLPLLGEAVRKFQEANFALGFVEALYLSARVLNECGRMEERDKIAARWMQARRKIHRATGLDVLAGDYVMSVLDDGEQGLDVLVAKLGLSGVGL